MAVTGEDVKPQELNVVFKSLTERGNEAKKWEEHTKIVLFYVLEQITELLNKTESCIMCKPYGSAAEDLKCIEPNDVGDVDIVIFPNSDHLMIYDVLIEYSPENPMHVKIKGVDHPVLQFCLAEGTDYVATSALKNFHPAIYGRSAPHIADSIIRAHQIMSQEGLSSLLQSTSYLKNNATSPAVTVNFVQSLTVKDSHTSPHDRDIHPDEWEWLVYHICNATGTVYTREHAKVIDNITQFANEIEMSANNQGLNSISEMLPVFQEFYWSDGAKNRRARFRNCDIKSRSENETQRKTEICMDKTDDKQCVSSETRDEYESGQNNANCFHGTSSSKERLCVKAQDAEEVQRSAENLEFTRCTHQLTIRNPSANVDQYQEKMGSTQEYEREDVADSRETKRNEDLIENQNESKTEEQSFKKKRQVISDDQPRNRYGNEEDEKREFEKRRENFLFDHLFGTLTDTKEDSLKESKSKETGKSQQHQRKGGFDFVPAFRSRGWPKVAQEWIKRQRKWPSPDIVDEVIQEGFHLVVKPPKNGGNPNCDFRISFAHAEYLLSQDMNDIQRECYLCLKKFHRAYLSTDPKSLVSFHLKNLLLQTIEETGAEMWTESNRAECVMKLLGNLLEALRKKDLRHYFVRSYNLFSVDYVEDPKILDSLAGVTEQIMENPMQFAIQLIQKQESEETKQVKKEDCIPSCNATLSANTTTEQRHASKVIEDTPYKGTQSEHREATNQGRSSFTSYRYYDLKDTYLAVSKELTNTAFNDLDCSLEALDPLQRSLVEGLREIERLHIIHVDDFPKMFDICWNTVYCSVLFSSEPNTRRRILVGIQGVVEVCKYVLKQDDFASGNEEAISRRMLDPSTEDSFDLNHVFPAGSGTQFIRRLLSGRDSCPAQSHTVDLDDIPLD